ncbi:GNAT family N-acetyltransferase [Streptomyces sp. NPDC087917]|uniref:GNAT family N-acetyltransferase n=1 Tax=Streptomyces sp. NPDC087917 TaxID=3155060 RepID=UPI0034254911
MDDLRWGVRDMVEGDVGAVSEVRVRGWQWAYVGLVPSSYLDGLDVGEDAARRRGYFADGSSGIANLVAEDAGGDVVGWAAYGPPRGGELPQGEEELFALYARPELVGTGIGRALLGEVLRRTPHSALRLWVVEGNTRARRFYERAGFLADGAGRVDEYHGVLVPEVRYHRPRE